VLRGHSMGPQMDVRSITIDGDHDDIRRGGTLGTANPWILKRCAITTSTSVTALTRSALTVTMSALTACTSKQDFQIRPLILLRTACGPPGVRDEAGSLQSGEPHTDVAVRNEQRKRR
jgi:hypothetical protein